MTQFILKVFVPLLPVLLGTASINLFLRASPKKAWAFSWGLAALTTAGLFFLDRRMFPLPLLFLGAAANFAGAALFAVIFPKIRERNLGDWLRKNKELEERTQQEELKRNNLKVEFERAGKEIDKSLLLYATVKGMGEALSWEEMTGHIDFAVTRGLGLSDYQLYLIEDFVPGQARVPGEKRSYKKALSKGTRLLSPPDADPSVVPRFHQGATELYLEVPVRHGDETIAILWARLSPNQNTLSAKEEILHEAIQLSAELGPGLEKALLFSSLENLSRVDGLTGTFRRQIFNERLDEEFRRARTFRTVFSLLIADLDHFKRVNDTLGHQAGDAVLKRVGEILKESIYETDFVARYGGEEFVILFPQADPQGVLRKAEALRARIEREVITFGLNRIRLTISIGVAHYPAGGDDPVALVGKADEALYAAKNMGRNRVVDHPSISGAS